MAPRRFVLVSTWGFPNRDSDDAIDIVVDQMANSLSATMLGATRFAHFSSDGAQWSDDADVAVRSAHAMQTTANEAPKAKAVAGLLDELPADKAFMLDVVLVTPSVEGKGDDAVCAGAGNQLALQFLLLRAVKQFGALVTLVPLQEAVAAPPAIHKLLRLEVVAAKEAHAICEFVAPLALWRGDLAMYDEEKAEHHYLKG